MPDYAAIEAEELVAALRTSADGLSDEEAERRKVKRSIRFVHFPFDHLRYLIIIVFFISSLAFINTGAAEGYALLVLSAALLVSDVLLHLLSSRALAEVHMPVKTSVYRSGALRPAISSELVPGDVVQLQKGAIMPADCRIIEGHVAAEDELGSSIRSSEAKNSFLRKGSIVKEGEARAVVVHAFSAVPAAPFAWLHNDALLYAFLPLAAVIFFGGVFLGFSPPAAFLLAITLLLFAEPLGAWSSSSLALGKAMQNMAEAGLVAKDAVSAEKLAKTGVFLLDKGGFFASADMRVAHAYVDDKLFTFRAGEILFDGKPVVIKQYRDLQLVLGAGMLCSSADLESCTGEPVELALLEAAVAAGIKDARSEYEKLAENPYSAERQRYSAAYRIGNRAVFYSRGSLDAILQVCTHIISEGRFRRITEGDVAKIRDIVHALSSQGYSIAAFAVKRTLPAMKLQERDLAFLGLVAITSEPHADAKNCIASLSNAGVKAMLLTSEDKESASATAKELGLEEVLTGKDVDKLSDEELQFRAPHVRVFAGLRPEHKARLAGIFQRLGQTVALASGSIEELRHAAHADLTLAHTHAPEALRHRANILVEKGLQSIADSVEKIREVNQLARHSFLHSASFATALAALLLLGMASPFLFGMAFAFTPVQALWLLLIFTLPLAALRISPDETITRKLPADFAEPLFGRSGYFILPRSLLFIIVPVAIFIALRGEPQLAFTALFTSLVFLSLAALVSAAKPGPLSPSSIPKITAAAALLAAVAHIIAVSMQAFSFVQFPPQYWIALIALALAALVFLEYLKIREPSTRPLKIEKLPVRSRGWTSATEAKWKGTIPPSW